MHEAIRQKAEQILETAAEILTSSVGTDTVAVYRDGKSYWVIQTGICAHADYAIDITSALKLRTFSAARSLVHRALDDFIDRRPNFNEPNNSGSWLVS